MADFGLLSTGFVPMTITDIKAAFQAGYQEIYGNPNLADDSVIGIRIGIMSKILADAWEALQCVYNAPFPALSDDASFSNVMDINGLAMRAATKTLVTCQCTGDESTVITVGSEIQNAAGDLFQLTEQVIIPSGGVVDGIFEAVESGPIPAPAENLTTIYTPISGWTSVTNEEAGEIGTVAETSTDARIRRASSLQEVGASALDAIVSRLKNDVPNVNNVIGFANDEDIGDSDGRPPHSMEFVISGGTDQDIGNMLWAVKSGGIYLNGFNEVDVLDSNGHTQKVRFTRPYEVSIYIEVTISEYNELLLPTNYEALIKSAIVEYGNEFAIGDDVYIEKWKVPCYGILGVNAVNIRQKKGAGSWVTEDIEMLYYQQTIMVDDNVTVIKS